MSEIASKYEKPKENLNKFQHYFYDYGRFHNNIVNILIHIIFVPTITISLLRMISNASKVYLESEFNLGWLIILATTPVYIWVDFIVGTFTAMQYLVIDHLLKDFSFDSFNLGYETWKVWLAIHIAAWLVQFIGHGFFEKRKPALLDNIFLTLNAPIFVNLELVYFLFGYRKEELIESKKYIVADIKKHRGEKSR